MERLIKVGNKKVRTTMPWESCANCPAVNGEIALLIATIVKEIVLASDITAQVECFPRPTGKRNSRYMDIDLSLSGEQVKASAKVRNWHKRTVHCNTEK